jgi:hypothetical protein
MTQQTRSQGKVSSRAKSLAVRVFTSHGIVNVSFSAWSEIKLPVCKHLRTGSPRTGGCTSEGLSISQFDLNIPLSVLIYGFGTGAGPQPNVAGPALRKGLYPGKDQQRKKDTLSDF